MIDERRRKLKEDLQKTMSDGSGDLDPEDALAQALYAFYGDKYLLVMSYIKHDEDAQKIWVMLARGRRRKFGWYKELALDKLALLCATDKGVRARLLAEALKNINGVAGGEERMGLTDRIKSAFKRDFVSSQ